MRVSARGTLKPCLTNDGRHLAKWGEVHFISTRADCFIMLSPLDKTMWVCTEGWFWGQFLQSRPNNLSVPQVCCNDVGPGVNLFCSPAPSNAIVIAWAQVLSFFFLLHSFSLCPPAYFPLLDRVRDDNVKASQCCKVASGRKFILWWAGEKPLYNRDQGD